MAGDAGPQLRLHDSSLPAAGRCGLGAEPLPSPRGPGMAMAGTWVFSFVSGVGGVRVAGRSLATIDLDLTVRSWSSSGLLFAWELGPSSNGRSDAETSVEGCRWRGDSAVLRAMCALAAAAGVAPRWEAPQPPHPVCSFQTWEVRRRKDFLVCVHSFWAFRIDDAPHPGPTG